MPEQLSTVDNLVSENVTVNNSLQVPNITTAERDALTALSGWIIYNTTDDEFQVYDGNWTTMLSDGTLVNSSVIQSGNFSQHIERQKIQSLDKEANDEFGINIAISDNGMYIVVGATGEDTNGDNAGAVYIFNRTGTTWAQQQKIQSLDIESSDGFGSSVAINSDGTYIVVGATGEDTGVSDAGAAYIFTRSGSTWSQQQKIQSLDKESSDGFGSSVAINSDGTYIVVGASDKDTGGAVYIFNRSGTTWTQQQKIQATDKEEGDFFGKSAINSDGTYIVVGAGSEDTNGVNAGAAYIFNRSGTTWTQQQKIQSFDIEANDGFGGSVAINSDATYIAITSTREATGGSNAGAAYIFTRSGTTWTQQQKIQSLDIESEDFFGISVAINSDGTYIVVGAEQEDTGGSNAGAAYIFNRTGTTWTEQQKIQSSDIESEDFFGISVAINSDGTYIVVGANGEDTGSPTAGALYIFKGVEENVAPSFTETERDAIAVPNLVDGMIILNTTTSKLNFYTSSAWEAITSA